jgi:uncharacterized membrane protein (GlpM family)
MFLISLTIKAAAAGTIVLGLSLLAERIKPWIAGIIAGAPMGALLSFYMLGVEKGPSFVIAAVPHAIAGMTGVLVFVLIYHAVSLRVGRLNALFSTLAGCAAFALIALTLDRLTFTVWTALPLTVTVTVLAGYLFRRVADVRILRPARLTFGLSAALLVVSAVSLAEALGPRWAGILVGFPLTLLPTMLIIHLTYSRDHVHALLRGFPVGMGSVLTYLVTLPWTFGALGVHLGTLTSLLAAFGYLAAFSLLYRAWRRRQ